MGRGKMMNGLIIIGENFEKHLFGVVTPPSYELFSDVERRVSERRGTNSLSLGVIKTP